MDNNIVVDGVTLPPPAQEGVSYAPEAIWSENAGRAGNCDFVGDVRAVKGTLSITWESLTYSEVSLIRGAFTQLGKPFFNVTFTDDTGQRKVLRCYSTLPSSSIRIYNKSGDVANMTVDIVEV
ncbi:hypothetical protein Osc1_04960 [Hominimerdicola sp. 21CYCFAH17_S]